MILLILSYREQQEATNKAVRRFKHSKIQNLLYAEVIHSARVSFSKFHSVPYGWKKHIFDVFYDPRQLFRLRFQDMDGRKCPPSKKCRRGHLHQLPPLPRYATEFFIRPQFNNNGKLNTFIKPHYHTLLCFTWHNTRLTYILPTCWKWSQSSHPWSTFRSRETSKAKSQFMVTNNWNQIPLVLYVMSPPC